MQIATIEFARNVLKLEKAHSTELIRTRRIPSSRCWTSSANHQERRHDAAWRATVSIDDRTKAAELYGSFVLNERHRHRYEFNNAYRENLKRPIHFQRQFGRRQTRGNHRAERPSIFCGEPVSSQNFRASRTNRIRCSKAHRRRAPEHHHKPL